jgi:hypothetical protein
MLDRVTTESRYLETVEFEWHALSSTERRLIKSYRQLSEQEQQHIQRLAEAMAANPEK